MLPYSVEFKLEVERHQTQGFKIAILSSPRLMLACETVTSPQRQLQQKELFLFPPNPFLKLTPFFFFCAGKRTEEREAGKNK